MSDWETAKLRDVCDYENGRISITLLNNENYISTENMLSNKGGVCRASSLPSTSFATKFTKNQTLISNIRPYFKKIWFTDKDGGSSNDILCFKLNKNIDNKYFYYLLSQDSFFDYVMSGSKGSKMPRGDKRQIMQFEFQLPPIAEQERIAGILGALDDKIECNNRINRNLEEQAAALFRRWFVDFEFPDPEGKTYRSNGGTFTDSTLGEIPKGWKVGRLDELITVKYGKDHKKLKDGIIPVYGSGGIMRYADSALYTKETVLIPRKGTLNNVFLVNHLFWSVDTMFYTEMNRPNIAKFVYLFLKSKDLASMNAGSAVPSMTTEILNQMPIIIAPSEIYAHYDNVATSLFDAINSNTTENRTLAELRDSLLPKLMNNEIKI